LEKQKDLDAVKIMTPIICTGVLSWLHIKKENMCWCINQFQIVCGRKENDRDGTQQSKVITHLIPWDSNGSMDTVMAWINAGAIGTLKEVHNWTNRPVWPQYPDLPARQTSGTRRIQLGSLVRSRS
jgi:hypothetical protein